MRYEITEAEFLDVLRNRSAPRNHNGVAKAYHSLSTPSEACNLALVEYNWNFLSRVANPSLAVKEATIKCYIKYNRSMIKPSDDFTETVNHPDIDALFQFYRL